MAGDQVVPQSLSQSVPSLTIHSACCQGKLCVSKTSEDGLTHLTWTDRTQGMHAPLFPGTTARQALETPPLLGPWDPWKLP
jgi:hypothetical protein